MLHKIFGLLFICAVCVGCFSRPGATGNAVPKVNPLATPTEAVAAAHAALKVSGIPEPPISAKATRLEREKYLTAIESALESLSVFEKAAGDPPPLVAALVPLNRNEEVLTIGRALAVAFADSIERHDASGAKKYLVIASHYADFIARESVGALIASGGVFDCLCNGAKSVGGSIDETMAAEILKRVGELRNEAFGEVTAKAELLRLKGWADSVRERTEPLSVEELASTLHGDSPARGLSTEQATKLLRDELFPDGKGELVEATVLHEAAANFLTAASDYLLSKEQNPVIAETTSPLEKILIATAMPWLDAGRKAEEIRTENFQLLAMTIWILEGGGVRNPELSAVNGLPFEFHKNSGGIELTRPRPGKTSNDDRATKR